MVDRNASLPTSEQANISLVRMHHPSYANANHVPRKMGSWYVLGVSTGAINPMRGAISHSVI